MIKLLQVGSVCLRNFSCPIWNVNVPDRGCAESRWGVLSSTGRSDTFMCEIITYAARNSNRITAIYNSARRNLQTPRHSSPQRSSHALAHLRAHTKNTPPPSAGLPHTCTSHQGGSDEVIDFFFFLTGKLIKFCVSNMIIMEYGNVSAKIKFQMTNQCLCFFFSVNIKDVLTFKGYLHVWSLSIV